MNIPGSNTDKGIELRPGMWLRGGKVHYDNFGTWFGVYWSEVLGIIIGTGGLILSLLKHYSVI